MIRLVLGIVLAAGCATESEPVGYPEGLGTPENPLPGEAAYVVTTRLEIPLGNAGVTEAIADLRAFSQHGGHTMLAQNVGTSALQTLDALPASLRNNLEGWIDTELDKLKIGTVTVRQASGQIATIAESVTTSFTLESSLSISPAGATHSLRDLNFTPMSLDIIVPVGGLNADTITQHTTASVAEGGALELGEQKFRLGLGSHAWHGINLAATSLQGGDLSLLRGINCETVAQKVAARCVSGTCVGHTAELVSVCYNGMATLVDHLRDELAPIEMGTFHVTGGSGRLVDNNLDGVADRITDGRWEIETDTGSGVHKASVMFTALE